jgi:myo-inositol-1(or 4)-monophosphatase
MRGSPPLQDMVRRVRKCRRWGALDMAYVACGRFDAYLERSISLWDVAAGCLLVESAGGKIEMQSHADQKDKYSIVASNGVIDLGS